MTIAYTDDFSAARPSLGSPYTHCALVTPSNTDDLAHCTQAISITAAADVKVDMLGGETVVIPSGALAAGVLHRIRATRVYSTGTGSTTVVAWW